MVVKGKDVVFDQGCFKLWFTFIFQVPYLYEFCLLCLPPFSPWLCILHRPFIHFPEGVFSICRFDIASDDTSPDPPNVILEGCGGCVSTSLLSFTSSPQCVTFLSPLLLVSSCPPVLATSTECHCSDNYLLTCSCHHRPCLLRPSVPSQVPASLCHSAPPVSGGHTRMQRGSHTNRTQTLFRLLQRTNPHLNTFC